MENLQTTNLKKPGALRTIFIMTGLLPFIALTFYVVFTTQNISVGTLEPSTILYTAGGYALMFGIIVFSILRRSLWGLRSALIAHIAVSIPAGGYIGIVVALISMGLTFAKSVKTYMSLNS